jgi:hypothetical protein
MLSNFSIIVNLELSDVVLSKFAEGDWKVYDEQFASGYPSGSLATSAR